MTLTICGADKTSHDWLVQQPALSARLSDAADLTLTVSHYSGLLPLVSLRPKGALQRPLASLNMLALQSVWLVQGKNDFIEHFFKPSAGESDNYFKSLQRPSRVIAPLNTALALDAALMGKQLVFPEDQQAIAQGDISFEQAVTRAREAVAEQVAFQCLIPRCFVVSDLWWQQLTQSAAEPDSQWFEHMQRAAMACIPLQPTAITVKKHQVLPTPIRKLRKLMRDPHLFFADRQRLRN